MNGARQLALDLPHREALGRDDFLVSDSNAAAVAAIDAWPDWPGAGQALAGLVLAGPEGSGKSHLVEVWRQRSGARRIDAKAIGGDPVDLIGGSSAIAIEDCGPGMDQTAMFHLLNAAERAGAGVLITAKLPAQSWEIDLPDLDSRLGRLALVEINPPDDALMQAVMVKLFADRQLTVPPAIPSYLVARMERSFAAARDIVARLDRAAIEAKRPVTRVLAARILSEMNRDGD